MNIYRPLLIISLFAGLTVVGCRPQSAAPPVVVEVPIAAPAVNATITPVPQPLRNSLAISETNRWFPPNLRGLTDDEKNNLTKIALNSTVALKQLQKESRYNTAIDWIALIPNPSGEGYTGYRKFSYDTIETGIPIYPPGTVVLGVDPKTTELYPGVTILFGEPAVWIVSIAVDLKTGKVVYADEIYLPGPPPN